MREFEAAAVALHRCGYSVVPIYAGEKKPGVYGGVSADGTKGPWYDLKGWQELCTTPVAEATAASWGRMADAMGGGLGVACGYGNLVAIDVDHPDLIEPIRAILPPILVAKVGRKGFTAFYRGDHPRDDVEWWEKNNYRREVPDPDKPGRTKWFGLLDFLAVGSQTVLPPTRHKDTGEPYRWLTPATLLNTPHLALPLFTGAHRAAMEEVLRQHGWNAPEPAAPRREAVERPASVASDDMLWHDDVNDVALKNLSAWVPALGLPKTRPNGVGYRAVAPWRGSGSGRSESRRNTNLSFHPSGIKDFGTEETYTPIRVVAKARGIPNPAAAAWLRERLGLPEERLILASAGAVKPTYPDRSVSLLDATTELHRVLDDFEAEMKAWRIYRNQCQIKTPLIRRKPLVWGVKIATGGGKSFQAARKVAEWTRCGWRLVYAVSTVALGEQVERWLADYGITTRVYRGREQDDPDAPGKQMCQNLPAASTAIALGLSVPPAVCARRIDEKLVRCPRADVCGYERQREAKPDVWIVTFASLLYEKPDFLPELDGIVLDEKFHDNAVGEAVAVDTVDLWRAKIELCSDDEHDFLLDMRAKLRAVAEDNGDGSLSRVVLGKHQILPHNALRAATLEQRPVKPEILRPDMKESGLNLALHKYGTRNRLARDMGTLWEQIALFLAFDHPLSGRITVTGHIFTVTPLRSFHPSWYAPFLALDATLPTPEILDAAVFGDEVTGVPSTVSLKADIDIQWPDYVHVRQVLDAPVSMSALGLGETAKAKPRNERDILRYIHQRAALVAPARLGVISYLGLEERLSGQTPGNVRWMHFGKASGLNDFESVAGLVVIGRWWLPPERVEVTASVFAGYPVAPIGEYYRRRTGGIRMMKGSAVRATVECHPDPFAEAIRWSVVVGELLQAIGRLRAPRRGDPCFLDVVGDVVLPLAVGEVVQWDDICPGAESDMMAAGVVLTNSRDARSSFRLTKWDAENAEVVPESLIMIPIRDSGTTSPLRSFTYQKAGPGKKVNTGYLLPGVLPGGETALRTWLEAKLGSLAMLRVEPVKAKDSQASQAIFARIGRDIGDRTTRPLTGFRETLQAIEDFFAALGEDDDG